MDYFIKMYLQLLIALANQHNDIAEMLRNPHNKSFPTPSRHSPLLGLKKSSSYSNFSLEFNPLQSVNDLKYVGDQFRLGKLDPNAKPNWEVRFQKMYSSRLRKLHMSPRSGDPTQSLSEFRKTNDPKILSEHKNHLANELKVLHFLHHLFISHLNKNHIHLKSLFRIKDFFFLKF